MGSLNFIILGFICLQLMMQTHAKPWPVDEYLKLLLKRGRPYSPAAGNPGDEREQIHKLMGTRIYNGRKFQKPQVDMNKANSNRFELEREPPIPLKENQGRKRASYATSVRMWPNNVVRYGFHPDFTTAEQDQLRDLINEFRDSTCIDWIEDPGAMNIQFTNNDTGCWSYLGDVTGTSLFPTYQPLNLMNNAQGTCLRRDVVHHEMMHAIGYLHEQSRSDRDAFVTINYENVRSGYENNFAKRTSDNAFTYDYSSVMHYGLNTFTNGNGPTISAIEADQDFLVDSLIRMSFYDIQDILRKYQCTANCASPPTCLNGGYLNIDCSCKCPDLFTGSTCETPVAHEAGCGNTQITVTAGTPVTILSPNYDGVSNMATGFTCTYRVTGDANKKVKMMINEMNLANSSKDCIHSLEIRRGLPAQKGLRICGKPTNLEFMTYAPDYLNVMNVVLHAESPGSSVGFSATFSVFGADGTCAADEECLLTQSCVSGECGCPANAFIWNSATQECEAFSSTFETISDARKYFDYSGSSWKESVTLGGSGKSSFGPAASGGNAFSSFSPKRTSTNNAITSVADFPSETYCLTFLANVVGSSSALKVYAVTNSEDEKRSIRSSSGWQSYSLELSEATTFSLRFKGQNCNKCHYAIDNVLLTKGSC